MDNLNRRVVHLVAAELGKKYLVFHVCVRLELALVSRRPHSPRAGCRCTAQLAALLLAPVVRDWRGFNAAPRIVIWKGKERM